MTSTMISLRITPDLLTQAEARGETTSDGVRESLSRYFYMLDRARRELRDRFTPEELTALCRIGNGTVFEVHTLEGLAWNAEDATPTELSLPLDAKTALVDKLRGLTLLQHAALVDAVERFWRAQSTRVPVAPGTILDN